MKRYIPLILGLLAAVLSSNAARAEIRVTPTPDGEPASEYWSVEVDGKSSFVYAARTADPPFDSKVRVAGFFGPSLMEILPSSRTEN